MATEQHTTWICDRCGARAPERDGGGWNPLPKGWVQLNGMDLCGACWQSFCDWQEAPRKAKAAELHHAFLVGKSGAE